MNLTCQGCGLCCLEQGTPPFTRDGEDRPPVELDWPREEGDRYDRGLPCLWLDLETLRCRHYAIRPQVCREFELGGKVCVGMRS